jgi:Holliday junction resolvasome RuvABC endonuclease subunit
MSNLRVVGYDPSLRHWGVAVGHYDLTTKQLKVEHVEVIEPVIPSGKQVRNNSKDLAAATQLATAARDFADGAQAVFVEVPHGSQSARAMASYGVCLGVLGALRAAGIPFYELSESEVKLATVGQKTSTKKEMIEWAIARHPEAPWSTYKQNGKQLISEAKAEHQADAVAAIYAGLRSPQFLQTLQLQLPLQVSV